MSFHDSAIFPEDIAYGSLGGPTRKTNIVTLGSGFEERNATWADSRRQYNVSYGIKNPDALHQVIEFFEARTGALYGFRYKDFSDFKSTAPQQTISSTDQTLGIGDGAEQDFQLVKDYTSGGITYQREIKKPISGTVRVSLDDVEQLAGFSVDFSTGIVSFSSAPSIGVVVKAGFEFHTPVRFESDSIAVTLDNFNLGTIQDINLLELRV